MSDARPILKLKIVSDGTVVGTHVQVVDESGEAVGELVCVQKLTYVCDIDGCGLSRAEMTVLGVDADIAHDVVLTLNSEGSLAEEADGQSD